MSLHRAHDRLARRRYLNPDNFTLHLPSSVFNPCLLCPHFPSPSYFSILPYNQHTALRERGKRTPNIDLYERRSWRFLVDIEGKKKSTGSSLLFFFFGSSLLLNPTLTPGIQPIFNSEKPSENTQKLRENEQLNFERFRANVNSQAIPRMICFLSPGVI